jgi:hypothetical protein
MLEPRSKPAKLNQPALPDATPRPEDLEDDDSPITSD